MSRVAQVRTAQPLVSRPPRFRPDYATASECALAFARALSTGWMSYGELENRVLPFLAGPEWEREHDGRREAASIIASAVDLWVWKATSHAR